MGELGLSDQHASMIRQYLEFAQQQRSSHLRAIDCLFQDVLDSRLLETSYTVDEVSEILSGLRAVVAGEARDGLAGAAHAQVLLLQQLCTQAERWHLRLEANMSELENRSLLEQVKQLEEGGCQEPHAAGTKRGTVQDDEGPAALLHREIKRLSTIAAEQRDAMNDLEEKVAVVEAARKIAEVALRNAEQEAARLREQLQQLESELANRVNEQVPAPPANAEANHVEPRFKENEMEVRSELQQALARLTLAEQELQRRVNETAAFTNLRRMLDSKNEQLRDLRTQLAKLTNEEPIPADD